MHPLCSHIWHRCLQGYSPQRHQNEIHFYLCFHGSPCPVPELLSLQMLGSQGSKGDWIWLYQPIRICSKSFKASFACLICEYPAIVEFPEITSGSGIFWKRSKASSTNPFCAYLVLVEFLETMSHWGIWWKNSSSHQDITQECTSYYVLVDLLAVLQSCQISTSWM